MIAKMEERAEKRHREVIERAEERHREVVELIAKISGVKQ